jgi:hypothetical protein
MWFCSAQLTSRITATMDYEYGGVLDLAWCSRHVR